MNRLVPPLLRNSGVVVEDWCIDRVSAAYGVPGVEDTEGEDVVLASLVFRRLNDGSVDGVCVPPRWFGGVEAVARCMNCVWLISKYDVWQRNHFHEK